MSGWSNSTYRVELTVSGRIAATLPLPAAAIALNWLMTERSLVNDDSVMLAGPLLALVVVVVLAEDLGVLLQAAATMPTTRTSGITTSRVKPRFRILPSCFLWSFGFSMHFTHAWHQ